MALTAIFPGAATGITYTVNPDYYAALVAGTALDGYTFTNAAYADALWASGAQTALGDTGWMWCVYKDSASDAVHTFVYNTTTTEVVRFHDASNIGHYWSHELVLASFAEAAEKSFFEDISKVRSPTLSSANVTEVDGSASGWTAYHDALAAELSGLIDKYNWEDSAVVVARVTAIQEELNEVGKTITDSPLQSLLADFESARVATEDANESRYDQLIATASTPDPTSVMSYPSLAKHMLDDYYADIDDKYDEWITDQGLLDDEIVDELTEAWTTIDGYLDTIFSALDRGNWDQSKAKAWDQKLGLYQAMVTAKVGAMQQKADNQKQLTMAKLQWLAEEARRMTELYMMGPGVVERRVDVGPDLAAVANLTMQVGRGQASYELLKGFQPEQFIAPGTSSGLGAAISGALPK